MTGHAYLTSSRVPWFVLGFSALFFGTYFALFGDVGVYLGDEGYLWYGVQRTLAGEVPLREFQAYDPGRYYWCAAFARVFGQGLLGLRAAAMVFGAIGLASGMLVASRFARSFAELALCGALLGLWMFPTFKLFEPALACMATWFAVRLVEEPTPGRHLAAGLFVGVAGFFGRNHALYAGLACGLLALLCQWKLGVRAAIPEARADARPHRSLEPESNASACGLGIPAQALRPGRGGRGLALLALGAVVGYAPMWLMILFVPGFGASVVASTRIILQHGTNLPYPWRWPWTVEWSRLAGWSLVTEGALTLVFLLPCLVLPLGVLRALRSPAEELRRNAALAAAAFVGSLYIHHAVVRSFPHHLAQCLPPVLLLALGGVARLPDWPRRALYAALSLVLVLGLLPTHPVFSRFHPGWEPPPLVEHVVAGERLRVGLDLHRYLGRLERAIESQVPRDEPIFFVPNRPGFYPLFDRVAPVWWIYFFWRASDDEQAELVSDLERRGVDWVLVTDDPIDGREDLRFSATHPLLWAWIQREFEELEKTTPRPDRLFHRRE